MYCTINLSRSKGTSCYFGMLQPDYEHVAEHTVKVVNKTESTRRCYCEYYGDVNDDKSIVTGVNGRAFHSQLHLISSRLIPNAILACLVCMHAMAV